MKLKNIFSATQFDKSTLVKIFAKTAEIKKGDFNKNLLKDKIMATIFYEPSTRTRLSFESAMLRLGGSVISTENARQFSSASKGETLEDTIRIVQSYSDVIVLRHFEKGASQLVASYATVPIINAGDGDGEHPTQALLDLFTIFEKKHQKKLTVAMVGDLKYGRTIHSLSKFLTLYPEIRMIFVAPSKLSIPDDLRIFLKNKGAKYEETEDFAKILKIADVVYMTRIQKERFNDHKTYKKYFGKFTLSNENINTLKREAIIMHPLPRVNEINPNIDKDPRSIYFEQAKNGLYIRMALLASIFDKV